MEKVKLFGSITKRNISDQFLQECKRLIAKGHSRPSIPTVQALMLMYLAMSHSGQDRPARMYRFTAVEMLKRLDLERRFHTLTENTHSDKLEKRIISHSLWGIFLLETLVSLPLPPCFSRSSRPNGLQSYRLSVF